MIQLKGCYCRPSKEMKLDLDGTTSARQRRVLYSRGTLEGDGNIKTGDIS